MLISASGYLALAAVFAVSGAMKLRHPGQSAQQLAGYELFPAVMTMPMALGLAVAEISCAVLLLLPGARLAGLPLAGGLIVAFITAMSSALARGLRISCGCFGGQGELDVVGLPSLLRTVLLGVTVMVSLPGRTAVFQPAQVLVAAVMLALVILLAEMARLLPQPFTKAFG